MIDFTTPIRNKISMIYSQLEHRAEENRAVQLIRVIGKRNQPQMNLIKRECLTRPAMANDSIANRDAELKFRRSFVRD